MLNMDYLEKYAYAPNPEAMASAIEAISSNIDAYMNEKVLKACFSMMDLTSLRSNDTPDSISDMVCMVNALRTEWPEYPLPASICVYPNFASVVREKRSDRDVHVTVVAACFPSSQSFLDVKLLECRRAVEAGADEVDIVLALNAFLTGDYDAASREIRAVRECIDEAAAAQGRTVHLKVILETGLLVTAENIANASFLAMEAGADFIKTSTGKVEVNATPAAAYVMCECIKQFHLRTGKMVGFKPAGGISSAKDAVSYYMIVSSILGEKWLNKEYFRFGVSSLANKILSEVEKKSVKYF